MRPCICFIYTAVLFVFPSRTWPQPQRDTITLRTEIIGVKDGLSQGLITDIIQDKDGFMWFGTKDGLNKYDGYNFTIYRHEQDNPYSLPDNYISTFAEDDNGNFWVGTMSKGLYLFDRKQEKFYPVKIKGGNDSLANNSVFPWQYQNGKLMVRNTQLIIYDVSNIHPGNYESVDLSKAPVCFDGRQALPSDWNFHIDPSYSFTWMHDNSLWTVFTDSIIVYAPSSSGIYQKVKSVACSVAGLIEKEVYRAIELPQQDRFLFVGAKDLVVYDFGMKRVLKKIEFEDNYPFARGASRNREGNYFITTVSSSWHYLNSTDYSVKRINGKWGVNDYLDRNGVFWMGTSGIGLIKYDYRKQLFKHTEQKNQGPLKHNGKGELITLVKNQPCFLDPYTGKVRAFLPAGTWNPSWVLDEFATDKHGAYWMLYHTGLEHEETYLLSYNPANNRVLTKQLIGFSFGYPLKIIFDRSDNLWLGLFDMKKAPVLVKINKGTLNTETVYDIPAKSQNIFGYFISSYWQDAHDVFWFATLQGLYSFDVRKNKWQHWHNIPEDKNSLSNDQLLSLLPDPSQPGKYLWLGSDGGGLNRFEITTGKFISYTDRDGLPNNVVYSVLNDKEGNLWMSTNRGLSCFNPQKKIFVNFNSEDGLQGDEFNRHEYFKIPNGDLFFGGIEGGVFFNPEKVLENETSPAIVFTGLSVFNKPVSNKTDSSIIQLPVAYAQTITLPHNKSMFSISFAALEYRAAGKKQYKYFLEGYDKEWIDAGSKNEATYTNLSPGAYTFRVKAASSTGAWNEKGTSIQVVILAAWYQSWWFRLMVAGAAAGGAYAIYRYRLSQLLKLHKLRNSIARDLHDEIGSTLSSISLYGESAKMMITEDHPLNGVLTKISNSTDNMMESMSDIVWAINTRNDQFDNLINRMNVFAYQVMEAKGCKVFFETNTEIKKLELNMEQRKNIYLLYKEIVNNAAKHSCCVNLRIKVFINNNLLELNVKDDGKGFNINETGLPGMGGNGLMNIKKRADDLNASINIISSPGNGTETILKMRIKV